MLDRTTCSDCERALLPAELLRSPVLVDLGGCRGHCLWPRRSPRSGRGLPTAQSADRYRTIVAKAASSWLSALAAGTFQPLLKRVSCGPNVRDVGSDVRKQCLQSVRFSIDSDQIPDVLTYISKRAMNRNQTIGRYDRTPHRANTPEKSPIAASQIQHGVTRSGESTRISTV